MSVLKRVKISDVETGMIIVRCDKAGVPFNEYAVPLTDISKALALAEFGVEHVYIWVGSSADMAATQTLKIPKEDDIRSIDIAAAGEIVNRAKIVVEQTINNIRKGRLADMSALNVMVSDIIHTATDIPGVFTSMTPLKHKLDQDDFTHSLNVCVLALSIGQIMGLKGKELIDLGLASIFHDIGITRVPDRILTKQTALTEMEYSVLKKHPDWGYELLERNNQINKEVLVAVSQHHEYCDGSGYPSGLQEMYLTRISKILSVAEDYETMTNGKMASYRAANNTEAVKRIYAGMGKQYNDSVVKAFVSVIGVFPVGTMVKLSDGNTAIVCEVNVKDQSKPKAIVLGKDGKGERSFVNLAKNPDLKIASAVNHNEYGVDPDDVFDAFLNDRIKAQIPHG